jgi:hypothetical protein
VEARTQGVRISDAQASPPLFSECARGCGLRDASTLPARVLALSAVANLPALASMLADVFAALVFLPDPQLDMSTIRRILGLNRAPHVERNAACLVSWLSPLSLPFERALACHDERTLSLEPLSSLPRACTRPLGTPHRARLARADFFIPTIVPTLVFKSRSPLPSCQALLARTACQRPVKYVPLES